MKMKEEFGELNEQFSQLNEDELEGVSGGMVSFPPCPRCGAMMFPQYRPNPVASGTYYRVFVCQNSYCRYEYRM